MSLSSRQELITTIRARYQSAAHREKSSILNGFIMATGYQRKYAIHLLNKSVTNTKQNKIGRCPKYTQPVQQALIMVWNAANRICAKRLIPFLPELVGILEQRGHLTLSSQIRALLLSVSAATADRMLQSERQCQPKGLSTTKPGNLLKKQIQIRTFNDWNDVVPGYLEGDLVAHCGETAEGSFLNTFVLTDIATGWTEFLPLLCKSSANIVSGIEIIKSLLPFPILGVDTDNGSEFINYDLLNYCKEHKITFTRSRPYKKNDQAHVEEKNGSIIRRLIGYDRYEGESAWQALVKLYAILRLYINYFQPSMKLISKTRDGSKVTKKYDKAKTPYQRSQESNHLSKTLKQKLSDDYSQLDPVVLLKQISECQEKMLQHAWSKQQEKIRLITQQSTQHHQVKDSVTRMVEDTDESSPKIETHKIVLPNRNYPKSSKPRKPMSPRTWRTRKDPFEHVWKDIELKLQLSPELNAKVILDELIIKEPDIFKSNLLRTLQRRIVQWRSNYLELKRQNILNELNQDRLINSYPAVIQSNLCSYGEVNS